MSKFGFVVNNSDRGAKETIFMEKWGSIYRCEIDDVCIIYTPEEDFSDYDFFTYTKYGHTWAFVSSEEVIDYLNRRWYDLNPALACLQFVVDD